MLAGGSLGSNSCNAAHATGERCILVPRLATGPRLLQDTTMGKSDMTQAAATRIQSAAAKAGGGMVKAGSFAARAARAAARNAANLGTSEPAAADDSSSQGSNRLILAAAALLGVGLMWAISGSHKLNEKSCISKALRM